MSDNMDKFWDNVSNELRRALHLRPLNADEAEQACKEASDVPLNRDQIEAIVASATGAGSDPEPTPGPVDFGSNSEVEDEMLVLNRNAARKTPEVQRRLDELRRKLLEDDDDPQPQD